MLMNMLRAAAGWASQTVGGIPTDYIAFYTMDNISGSTLVDETGNYNGTISGAVATAGVIGNALSFSGAGDSVALPAAIGQLGLPCALSVWAEPSALAGNDRIFQSDDWADVASIYYGWTVNLKADGSVVVAVGSGGIGAGYRRSYVSPPGMTAVGEPMNIAVNINSHLDVEIFVNGVSKTLTTSGTGTGMATQSTPTPRLSVTGSGSPYSGELDQIRIYDRALSQEEITALYNEV